MKILSLYNAKKILQSYGLKVPAISTTKLVGHDKLLALHHQYVMKPNIQCYGAEA